MNTLVNSPILLKTSNQEVILKTPVEVERGAGKRKFVVTGGEERGTTHTVAGDIPAND